MLLIIWCINFGTGFVIFDQPYFRLSYEMLVNLLHMKVKNTIWDVLCFINQQTLAFTHTDNFAKIYIWIFCCSASDQAWLLLKTYLDKYEEPNGCYHRVTGIKLLSHDFPLPTWFVNPYKVSKVKIHLIYILKACL